MVWLASDEEGEAISWHLAEELKLDSNQLSKRITQEIAMS
jgi:DNA topoisomerase-1